MSSLPHSSRNIVILATSIFIAVTLLTMKLETGLFTLGYPWTFYTYTDASWSIEPVFFILEWLMIAALMVVVIEGIKRIRKHKPA